MKNIKDSYWIDRLKELGVVVIIPTYNNDQTLSAVISDVKSYSSSIIIVNDGSTDSTSEILAKTSDIHLITYSANRGKGVALKLGFIRAKEMGFRYAITIDSDGQHFASDIPHFIDYIEQHPDSLIVGSRNIAEENMPGKNTFCRFCAFYCKQDDPRAYLLSTDQILAKCKETVAAGGTQVMIQGGRYPGLGLDYYLDMLRAALRCP